MDYSGRYYSFRQDEEAVIRDAAEGSVVGALAAVSAEEEVALAAAVLPARGNIAVIARYRTGGLSQPRG